MVLVFREVRRVLRDDGCLWMNYGDSYSGGAGKAGGGVFEQGRTDGRPGDGGKERWKQGHQFGELPCNSRQNSGHRSSVVHKPGYKSPFLGTATSGSPYLEQGKMTGYSSGLKSGNLVGVPWRVALALQADGWILRQDIIWHKPACMPESVVNRCTKSHEYLFLLAKGKGYYYDAEAIKTRLSAAAQEACRRTVEDAKKKKRHLRLDAQGDSDVARIDRYAATTEAYAPTAANKRSVWSIASQGYPGAHYATFPWKLVEPCIKAGTSEKGCCEACGAPWRRIVERKNAVCKPGPGRLAKQAAIGRLARTAFGGTQESPAESKTIGWEPTCSCDAGVVPCVVLDPFCGSATTQAVSLALGRRSIGIDLSETYLRNNAIPRIEGVIHQRPALRHLASRQSESAFDEGELEFLD
jgi:hypothetical protein